MQYGTAEDEAWWPAVVTKIHERTQRAAVEYVDGDGSDRDAHHKPFARIRPDLTQVRADTRVANHTSTSVRVSLMRRECVMCAQIPAKPNATLQITDDDVDSPSPAEVCYPACSPLSATPLA